MRHPTLLLAAALLGLSALHAGPARAEPPAKPSLADAARRAGSVNGRCPVMGNLVTPGGGSSVYAGEKIAFCCPGCAGKFDADPVRYMDRMRINPRKYGYVSTKPTLAAMREAKRSANSSNGRCPVMGRAVTPTGGAATYQGQRIAFCCPPCAAKFKADPQRYMRRMRADPLAYAYDRPGPTHAELRLAREAVGSVNGLCPVMGRAVTPKGGTAVYRGERIAFCCPPCKAKFEASPETYMARLRAEPEVHGYLPTRR